MFWYCVLYIDAVDFFVPNKALSLWCYHSTDTCRVATWILMKHSPNMTACKLSKSESFVFHHEVSCSGSHKPCHYYHCFFTLNVLLQLVFLYCKHPHLCFICIPLILSVLILVLQLLPAFKYFVNYTSVCVL